MQPAPPSRLLSTAALVAIALVILLLPGEARAWGPLAHLDFSAQALASASVARSSMRLLLQDFASEFLYGSLAADIVVGKNLARHVYHCHNWRVGFNVYRQARGAAEQAFALGFLAHLAADTVAHNYFVPWKTLASFRKRGATHAYWELRYEQRMDPGLARLARNVCQPDFRWHDRFLRRNLAGASVIPFGVSRQLFGTLLASARNQGFQQLSRLALARERNLPLEADLVAETRRLSVAAVVGLLAEGERCPAAHADATGARNIRAALGLRRALQAGVRSASLRPAEASALVEEARDSFRRSIHGKLVLPASVARLAA
jgi:hypothetical protein